MMPETPTEKKAVSNCEIAQVNQSNHLNFRSSGPELLVPKTWGPRGVRAPFIPCCYFITDPMTLGTVFKPRLQVPF